MHICAIEAASLHKVTSLKRHMTWKNKWNQDLWIYYYFIGFLSKIFPIIFFFSSTGMAEKFKKDLNTEERSPRLDYIIDRK